MTGGKDNSARNWGIAGIVTAVIMGIPAWAEPVRAFLDEHLGIIFQVAYALYPLGAIALGFFAGWQLKKWRIGKSAGDRESDELRDEEELRAREIEAREACFLREPCGEKKAMAAVIYGFPDHRVPVDCKGVAGIESLESNHGRAHEWNCFFQLDDRGGGLTYVWLEKWIVELFDAKPELLDDFMPSVLEECEALLRDCEPF